MTTHNRTLEPVPLEEDEDRQELLADEQEDGTGVDVLVVKSDADGEKRKELLEGQAAEEQADQDLWREEPIVEPPYNTGGLLWMYRNSSQLRQNVEAMSHNIDGFGWQPDPLIDWDAEDLREQVATSIYLQRYAEYEDALCEATDEEKPAPQEPGMPTPEEISASINEWKQRAYLERARMKLFFDTCCFETSFIALRKQTRTDKETIGWGAWEVIRMNGRPRRFKHIPAQTIRLKRLGPAVRTRMQVRTSPVTHEEMIVHKRFRLIVQINPDMGDTVKRYFKEFGDPRVISSMTGQHYKNEDALEAKEKGVPPANEVLVFYSYFPGSDYGVNRWHGVIPELRGAWLAAQHNVDYLENSAIPRGMLLVSDGRLQQKSVKKAQNYFGTIKGKAQNRLAIIQGETPRDRSFEGSARVTMEWVSFADAQRDDAMFKDYEERVADKVGEAFRQPPILRGRSKDYNRATADKALQFAEDQVYAPERKDFDWTINNLILPELDIWFWRMRSLGSVKQDPEVVTGVLKELLRYGVVVPAEARPIAERLLGVDLLRTIGDWQNLPLDLVRLGFTPPKQRPAMSEGEDDKKTDDDEKTSSEGTGGNQSPSEPIGKELLELRQLVGAERFDSVVERHLEDMGEARKSALKRTDNGSDDEES